MAVQRIPFSAAESEFVEKRSRFIGQIWPVSTEEEAQAHIRAAKKKYHDARHHCFAYRLGHKGDRFRANDDGEPSSSAGRPILGQIDSRCLSDVLVVVVRYFGGIKLGIPGLIRAYKTSTADALDNAGTVEKIAGEWYRIRFGYLSMNQVMKAVKDMELPQKAQEFGEDCSMQCRVRLSLQEDFLKRMGDIEGCEVERI